VISTFSADVADDPPSAEPTAADSGGGLRAGGKPTIHQASGAPIECCQCTAASRGR
jgi:hypothetical protein